MKTIKYNGHQKIEKNYYSIDGINQTYQINNKKNKIVSKTNYWNSRVFKTIKLANQIDNNKNRMMCKMNPRYYKNYKMKCQSYQSNNSKYWFNNKHLITT